VESSEHGVRHRLDLVREGPARLAARQVRDKERLLELGELLIQA
jgi:hypothetical protein